MLICIPTNGNAGMSETLSDHFGSAPYFTIYNSESGEIQTVQNRNSSHAHGTCHPMTQLSRFKLNSIVCSGIGRRAIDMLKADGITVYQSDKDTVGEVVEQIKSNSLEEIDPATACKGHGQRQGFIHGAPGGCGHGQLRRPGAGPTKKS